MAIVITVTANEHLAEDLRKLLQLSVSSDIYEEKIGDREVILSIRARTAPECDEVKQVLKKAGIDQFTLDDEAA